MNHLIRNKIFTRNFYTYRRTLKELLNDKQDVLNKKIAQNIFVTENDTIYKCVDIIKNNRITIIPVVNNRIDKKLVSSFRKEEVELHLNIQEFHNSEDYINWNNRGIHYKLL